MTTPVVVVLVVAAGATWESAALAALARDPATVVLKRCVDVDDLLATAAAGQADVAVVALDAPGLDTAAADHLHRSGVSLAVVVPTGLEEGGRSRAGRLGVRVVLAADQVTGLPDAVRRAVAAVGTPGRHEPASSAPDRADDDEQDGAEGGGPDAGPVAGRVVVVWGPPGAPGRSTVAAGVAAELARRGLRTVLVDVDTHAPSLAQQLGVLDEVSGLLAAARLDAAGRLRDDLASVPRLLDGRLSLVTGLPRADRWREVRPGVVESLLDDLAAGGWVVVDTAAPLAEDPGPDLAGRARDQPTLEALGRADDLLVVGSADPVGLARLARGLVELRERQVVAADAVVRVLVNRMRPGLGWSATEVTAMVAGFAGPATVHLVPHDLASVDRALVAGRTLVEVGGSPLLEALGAVVDAVVGDGRSAVGPGPARTGVRDRVRRRRAARGRRR